MNHPSEFGINNQYINYIINNNSSIKDLNCYIKKYIMQDIINIFNLKFINI